MLGNCSLCPKMDSRNQQRYSSGQSSQVKPPQSQASGYSRHSNLAATCHHFEQGADDLPIVTSHRLCIATLTLVPEGIEAFWGR